MWRRREEGGEEKSLIDYIVVDERLRKNVLDAKVVREALEGSDHYAVVIKIRVQYKWEFCRKIGKEKRCKVLAKKRLGEEEVREEYRGKVSERLRVVEMVIVNMLIPSSLSLSEKERKRERERAREKGDKELMV